MSATRPWLCAVLLTSALVACGGKTGGGTGTADAGSPDAGGADAGAATWLDDPGAGGFQVALPDIQIAAGQERVVCYFAEVPDVQGNGSDVWSSRWRIAMDPQAHELITYRVRTTVGLDGEPGTSVTDGECLKPMNWADWPLVANAQQRAEEFTDFDLPDGVGLRFQPHEKLMVQVRWLNDTAQPVTGKAGINFYGAQKTPTAELGTIRAANSALSVCQSNPTPTFNSACQLSGPGVTVVGANGHLHSRGQQFSMYAWDGTAMTQPADNARFYQSQSWDHPTLSQGLMVALPPNGGVWWTCNYQWTAPTSPVTCQELNTLQQLRNPGANPDCCYVAGDDVPRNEQCTAFIYYYPKVDNVNCF